MVVVVVLYKKRLALKGVDALYGSFRAATVESVALASLFDYLAINPLGAAAARRERREPAALHSLQVRCCSCSRPMVLALLVVIVLLW